MTVEARTLVVLDDVSKVVAAAVVGFAHAHRVVREVDIAVVAFAPAEVSLRLGI